MTRKKNYNEITELLVKLTGNIVSIFIYHIKKINITLVYNVTNMH